MHLGKIVKSRKLTSTRHPWRTKKNFDYGTCKSIQWKVKGRCLEFPFTYSEINAYVFLTRQQWFYGTFKTDEQIIFLFTHVRAIISWCRLGTFNLTQRGMIKIDGKNDSRMKTTQWKCIFHFDQMRMHHCILNLIQIENFFYWYLIMILQQWNVWKFSEKLLYH